MGSNVADCELAVGRAGEAKPRARIALADMGDSNQDAGHTLDTLMMSLAAQGRFDVAPAAGQRAYADLSTSGGGFMMLDGLALLAAGQGRLRDAVVTAARSDAGFASRSFLRWPLGVAWRQRTDALLAAVPPDRLAVTTRSDAPLAGRGACTGSGENGTKRQVRKNRTRSSRLLDKV